jgi:hypothetical protein
VDEGEDEGEVAVEETMEEEDDDDDENRTDDDEPDKFMNDIFGARSDGIKVRSTGIGIRCRNFVVCCILCIEDKKEFQ